MTRPGFFPEVLDSTMMHDWRSCHQQWKRRHLDLLAYPGESIDLVAGGAFARGLEVARRLFWEHGQPAEVAVAAGCGAALKAFGDPDVPERKMNKNWDRVLAAIESYFDRYPLGSDYLRPLQLHGRYAIEFSFAEPLPIKHPVTGNPLIFAGRTDQLVSYHDTPFVEDDKTASQLGDRWSELWDLRAQFAAYGWAAKKVGIPIMGCIVRGVAFLKTQITHAEAIIYLEDWKLDRWYEQTLRDISEMIRAWEEGVFNYNLGDACTQYSGCPYKFLCTKKDPEPWIESYYVRHHWDPIRRVGTTLPWEAKLEESSDLRASGVGKEDKGDS